MAVRNSKYSALAEEVFLDSLLLFGPFDSYPEFQELFPSGYRNHPDVRLLYKSFQKQRKLLQQQVRRQIQQQYEIGQGSSYDDQAHPSEQLSLADAVKVLECISEHLEEECAMTKESTKLCEREIERTCREIKEKFLQQFTHLVDDRYFDILQDAQDMLT